jgi:hypothetical protein
MLESPTSTYQREECFKKGEKKPEKRIFRMQYNFSVNVTGYDTIK